MGSKVYYTSMKLPKGKNLFDKLDELCNNLEIEKYIEKHDITAIKTHFGEPGNTAFLRPIYVRKIIEYLHKFTDKIFVTDSNVLYAGQRSNAIDHMISAYKNGFNYSTLGVPVIIADGIRGQNYIKESIDGKVLKEVEVSSEIYHSDAIIVMAHFKGHELTGFGGIIKSLAMGATSKGAKYKMHANVQPSVKSDKCINCGLCQKWCNFDAIETIDCKAHIIENKCTGCGACVGVCPTRAIKIGWGSPKDFWSYYIDHAYGTIKNKGKKAFYFNFLMNISPQCDCYPRADAPIVPDIGIVCSDDPVACDKASLDLVDKSHGLPNTRLGKHTYPNTKKIKAMYPNSNYELQFIFAEEIGMGTQDYELIKI